MILQVQNLTTIPTWSSWMSHSRGWTRSTGNGSRGVIADLRREGKTVVLSTHQMNLVEVLCDRILLVNRGRSVLYGPLADIKRQFAPHTIRVRAPELPAGLPGVVAIEPKDGAYDLSLAEGTAPRDVLRALVDRGVDVQAFEVAPVPLEEIFIQVVTVAQDSSWATGGFYELAQNLDHRPA